MKGEEVIEIQRNFNTKLQVLDKTFEAGKKLRIQIEV
jgi:hypothetical protein